MKVKSLKDLKIEKGQKLNNKQLSKISGGDGGTFRGIVLGNNHQW